MKTVDNLSARFDKAADAVPLTSLKIEPSAFMDAETAKALGIELQ